MRTTFYSLWFIFCLSSCTPGNSEPLEADVERQSGPGTPLVDEHCVPMSDEELNMRFREEDYPSRLIFGHYEADGEDRNPTYFKRVRKAALVFKEMIWDAESIDTALVRQALTALACNYLDPDRRRAWSMMDGVQLTTFNDSFAAPERWEVVYDMFTRYEAQHGQALVDWPAALAGTSTRGPYKNNFQK